MAEQKPLKIGATGAEQFTATDTFPVANVPPITSAKVSDFTEAAQDAAGAMATDSTTVDFTYNDVANTLSAAVITQMSVTSDASGVKLSGDEASPGNSQYYGTDGAGAKGFHDLPSLSLGETYTAGEAITAPALCYVNASGQIMKADARDIAKKATGYVLSSVSNGGSGTFYRGDGKITGYTGLTAGALYHLSNSTTGAIADYASLTFAANEFAQTVGRAESTTVLSFIPGDTLKFS